MSDSYEMLAPLVESFPPEVEGSRGHLDAIAAGGGFDVVVAVRVLATELVNLKAALSEVVVNESEQEVTLLDLLGNSKLVASLAKHGLTTVDAVRVATDEALLAVDGVNAKGLAQIREKTK